MSTLDETNFRETAQAAIKKYGDSGMIIDSLLWGTIVGLYEAALTKQVEEFARAILHGDKAHRAWLLDAAKKFAAGEPMPERKP